MLVSTDHMIFLMVLSIYTSKNPLQPHNFYSWLLATRTLQEPTTRGARPDPF